jgi:VanZ family protein
MGTDKKIRYPWIAWILFVLVWSCALLTPQPTQLASSILPREMDFFLSKSLHVAGYAILALLTSALPISSRGLRWLVWGLLLLHALGTEFFQQFIPLRTASWRDVGLDYLGILLGFLLSRLVISKRPKKAAGEKGGFPQQEEQSLSKTNAAG